MYFSVVIPVYNRPDEVAELLGCLARQNYDKPFEVVVVEDGSTIDCQKQVVSFQKALNINYLQKENSGPGDTRNFAMRHASGDFFLILDSDCLLPDDYLAQAETALAETPADCFGGVDDALDSFSDLQKAINFAMTSPLTTGGIRGASEKLGKFQPRSFNMGIARSTFERTGGFAPLRIGEDPDFSMRLWEEGLSTRLFANVRVFHKRRTNWTKFFRQVNQFGQARPILDIRHPKYAKPTFMFPSLFVLYTLFSVAVSPLTLVPLMLLAGYFALCGIVSTIQNRNLKVGLMSIGTVLTQFGAYGMGYIASFLKVRILKISPEKAFPYMFLQRKPTPSH